jgi:ABC-type transport system involved in multi-copper enzyme maturation permease subunit
MNTVCRQFRALFLHEWIMLRAWVIGLTLVVLAGPMINLLNAVGTSPSVRLMAVFESIYLEMPSNELIAGNQHIMAIFNFQTDVPFQIYGAPPASLWVLGVAMSLAALLVTYGRYTSLVADTFSTPIRKSTWLTGKFLFGISALICMVGLRTILLGISNTLSSWHFSAATICLSGMMNLALGIVTFAVVFLISLLVNNFLLASALGFLALSFPLALGAAVGFFNFTSRLGTVTHFLEHRVLLKLSPFWFTDYMTRTSEQFSSPVSSVQNTMKSSHLSSINMSTAIGHPWLLAGGAVLVCFILYLCSRWVFAKTQVENLESLFISPIALHFCLMFVSIIVGSIPAQVIGYSVGHASIPIFLGVGTVSYLGLWVIYQRLWVNRMRQIKFKPFG